MKHLLQEPRIVAESSARGLSVSLRELEGLSGLPTGLKKRGLVLFCSSSLFVFALGLVLALFRERAVTLDFILPYFFLSILSVLLWRLVREDKSHGQSLLGSLSLVFFFPMGLVLSSGWLFWNALRPPPEEGQGELGREDMKVFKLPRQPWVEAGEDKEELFVPAVSLLERGNIEERRAAIEVLAQIGGPQQVRHLQACLDDPEREVYQYAHAKLTELQERHIEAIRSAESQGKKTELLEGYLQYISSGLLGEATQDFYRQKAVRTAVHLLQDNPESVALLNLLGGLYTEQGAEQEARLHLEKALNLEPESAQARYTLARIAYSQQDFKALTEHLKPLQGLVEGGHDLPSEILEAVNWWLEGHDD